MKNLYLCLMVLPFLSVEKEPYQLKTSINQSVYFGCYSDVDKAIKDPNIDDIEVFLHKCEEFAYQLAVVE